MVQKYKYEYALCNYKFFRTLFIYEGFLTKCQIVGKALFPHYHLLIYNNRKTSENTLSLPLTLKDCCQLTILIHFEIYIRTKDLLFSFLLKIWRPGCFCNSSWKKYYGMFLINTGCYVRVEKRRDVKRLTMFLFEIYPRATFFIINFIYWYLKIIIPDWR